MDRGWMADHPPAGQPLPARSLGDRSDLRQDGDENEGADISTTRWSSDNQGENGIAHAEELEAPPGAVVAHAANVGEGSLQLHASTPLAQASMINLNGDPVTSHSLLYGPPEDDSAMGTPNYFDWKGLFPELKILVDEFAEILEECSRVSAWKAWPEKHYDEGGGQDWKVFPFVHTFPANDESRRVWIESTCLHCPRTRDLLRRLPNIRTALFSRLGGGSRISGHRGWADLANYVLRCHLPLKVPADGPCGLWVNGEVRYHAEGEIIVFDDSKLHKAFNHSAGDRLVLIVDLLRPSHIPLGTADGGHTAELDSFIEAFR